MRTLGMAVVVMASVAAFPSAAEEILRPLQEDLTQENSPHMAVYVLKRCAGLYGASCQRMLGSNRADVQEMLPKFQDISAKFMFDAIQGAQTNKLAETSDTIMNDVVALAGLYGKMMDQSYLQTGNSTDGQVGMEMELCNALRGNS